MEGTGKGCAFFCSPKLPYGLVVEAMDFGVSTSGSEARLCHLIFYLFRIEPSLRKQAWRNPKRVGCLHQNIITRKVTEIAFTSDFYSNYSHPASHASLYLTPPRTIDCIQEVVMSYTATVYYSRVLLCRKR